VSGTTTSYAYDADGRQLTGKQGSTTLTSATWNGASQLTAYSSPSATMTATYDGDGLRASEGGSTSQAFTWEVGNDQLLMDSTNAYIYGPGGTVAEQVNLSTGTASYLITDTIDSTRGIVSTSGALLAKTSYDAWGNPATSGGLTSYTPFGFAGGYTDPDGLIYLINRYYNPAEGQFISADPALSETGEPYAYTGGDPLMDKDPDGLKYHHFSKTLSFAITTNTINWDLSLCAGQYVSACAGVGFSVKKTQGKVTFAVGWYSYKNTVSLSNASGTFDTCHWVDTGPHGNFRYCNRGLVQPVFGFYLWTPSVFGQKQKLLWGYNDQLSDNDKPVKQGGTGEIPLGPSKEQPRKSYFTWQLWALNDWSGQAEGGGQWYPVPQANLGHILL
jgi:RHS repeat-associated protein